MMCGEVPWCPQCRVGLAPTVSLVRRVEAWSGGDGWSPGGSGAVGGDARGPRLWPVVITACRCRRIAAAITVWAWVGGELVVLAGGQVSVAGGVDGVGVQRTPDRPPGREPQSGSALAGELGAADEGAGQLLPRCQAGVLDQGPGGGEPVRVAGLGQDRGGADR